MIEYVTFSVLVCFLLMCGYAFRSATIIYITLIVLIAFMGLRSEVGTDYPAYVEQYERLPYPLDITRGKEVGYTLMSYFNKYMLGLEYQSVFLFCAFFTIFFVYASVSRNKSFFFVCFGLFLYVFAGFYTQSFNIIRQALGMAICLYSLDFAYQKKPVKFFLLVGLASSFHVTSLLMAPVYFFSNKRLNKKSMVLILCISIFTGSVVVNVLGSIFESLGFRYAKFFLHNGDDVTSGSGLMQLVTLSLCLFSIYHSHLISKKYLVYFNVFFLFCVFNLVFINFNLGIRAVQVYKIALVVFIPYLFSLFSGYSRFLILLVCAVYYVGFIRYLAGSTNIIPYALNLSF